MPSIPDEILDEYKCVMMYDDERVADALAALRDADGLDWWYLVIDLEQGGYAVAAFSELENPLKELGAVFLETPLSALVGAVLRQVEAAEQDTLSLNEAQQRAFNAPGRALIVEKSGSFRGLIPHVTRRGLFESNLIQLAGEYAPLPQQGMFSRRRLQAKKSKSAASSTN
jgi:hypothetical protein